MRISSDIVSNGVNADNYFQIRITTKIMKNIRLIIRPSMLFPSCCFVPFVVKFSLFSALFPPLFASLRASWLLFVFRGSISLHPDP